MTGALRLASAPINWGVESPGDPGNPNPDAMLQAIAEAGYAGSELGPPRYFGESADAIRRRFERHNLEAVAIWVDIPLERPLSDETRASLQSICGILRDVGAGHLLVSAEIRPERLAVVARVEAFQETWWSKSEWRQVRETLLVIGEIAADYGIAAAVHPHVGGHIESGREIELLLEGIHDSPVGLCIDTGHIRIGGIDSIPLLRAEMSRVMHVHAKDVDPELLERLQKGQHTYREAVGQGLYCDLGSGMVDWRGFQQALADTGFSGWVVAEQDRILEPESRAPFDSNQRNFAFLQDLLGAA